MKEGNDLNTVGFCLRFPDLRDKHIIFFKSEGNLAKRDDKLKSNASYCICVTLSDEERPYAEV